jgi:hypothetical protein
MKQAVLSLERFEVRMDALTDKISSLAYSSSASGLAGRRPRLAGGAALVSAAG